MKVKGVSVTSKTDLPNSFLPDLKTFFGDLLKIVAIFNVVFI